LKICHIETKLTHAVAMKIQNSFIGIKKESVPYTTEGDAFVHYAYTKSLTYIENLKHDSSNNISWLLFG